MTAILAPPTDIPIARPVTPAPRRGRHESMPTDIPTAPATPAPLCGRREGIPTGIRTAPATRVRTA
ncbi:hypothetical protein GCM10009555_052060 [Acrocarpospora macrocephala]|uniref:Uncharacterized protein n=1 Tax=Acrocarpospora macrocephala TaxID=150177 RepID=A0A5M3WT22_9ACTN|nr:hypothetical protein [Acrocarpospora macrocephala]GES09328.1 hypothetical protein Amac_029240 [Acrocarpospora macrocephala]